MSPAVVEVQPRPASWPTGVDIAVPVAALLLALTLAVNGGEADARHPDGLAFALLATSALPLLGRRRRPVAALLAHLVLLAAYFPLNYPGSAPLPLTLVGIYALAVGGRRAWTVVALGTLIGLSAILAGAFIAGVANLRLAHTIVGSVLPWLGIATTTVAFASSGARLLPRAVPIGTVLLTVGLWAQNLLGHLPFPVTTAVHVPLGTALLAGAFALVLAALRPVPVPRPPASGGPTAPPPPPSPGEGR